MSLSEGQVLDGKYVITRRIAEGGMSTVYLGVNKRIGRDVAVKVVDPVVARDPDLLERFEREARIASRVRSPHVADVYDFGELETGERFMVMEYLEGESLARRLERDRTLPPRLLATIASQILDALSAAHGAGIIHRDLKPENAIIVARGRDGRDVVVKLVDFGISKIVGAPDPGAQRAHDPRTTAAGALLGTPLYMSPEQARGDTGRIDHRTDLYSLGVILYEATAGAPPFTGENVNELLFRVALDAPVPLAERVPSVDPMLATIVKTAMAKDPADRYQSAEEMREAVEAWRAGFASGALAPTSVDGLASSVRLPVPAAGADVAAPVVTTTSLVAPSGAPRDSVPWTAGLFERVRWIALPVAVLAVLLLVAPAARRAILAREPPGAAAMTSGAVAQEDKPRPPLSPPPQPAAIIETATAGPPLLGEDDIAAVHPSPISASALPPAPPLWRPRRRPPETWVPRVARDASAPETETEDFLEPLPPLAPPAEAPAGPAGAAHDDDQSR